MTTSYQVISRHVFIVLFFVFCSPSKNISSIYTSHTLLTSRLETYKAPVPGKLRDAEGCQRCYSRFSAGAILLDSGAGGPVPVSKSAKGVFPLTAHSTASWGRHRGHAGLAPVPGRLHRCRTDLSTGAKRHLRRQPPHPNSTGAGLWSRCHGMPSGAMGWPAVLSEGGAPVLILRPRC